ncbi:MAG: hypothetical protein JSS07_11405 [Proteobacteria bacterium]|nr:hypothetical protein [Pseudomonadota bacterium]
MNGLQNPHQPTEIIKSIVNKYSAPEQEKFKKIAQAQYVGDDKQAEKLIDNLNSNEMASFLLYTEDLDRISQLLSGLKNNYVLYQGFEIAKPLLPEYQQNAFNGVEENIKRRRKKCTIL